MTQEQSLKIMHSGANVFLTGAPGAGKTYVLNQFIEQAEEAGKTVAITASTGIAASHIGGITIHSWSGLGIAEKVDDEDLYRMRANKRLRQRYEQTEILVIDEVSMLHGFRLDLIDQVARFMRRRQIPFGGMQVILIGDLFQLPPVSRDSSEFDFVHHSNAWQTLDLKICYLTEQHRQETDDGLLELLECMRQDTLNEGHRNLLQTRTMLVLPDQQATRLYSHNVDVDMINQTELDALPGKMKTYNLHASGAERHVNALIRNILAPYTLQLKVGAEVMFVANNFQAGFVNGSQGKVTKFKDGYPLVKLKNGRTIRVEEHSWKTKEDERVVAEVTQLPLRLAWAITVHKSQGMSLDAAEIDLSKAFMPGMGYVALSRVRSLEGLFLVGVNEMALKMHSDIYEFDAALRLASEGEKHEA